MKMNKIIGFTLLAASVAASFQVSAALTTDLNISGEIANAACDVTLAANGIVDFGDMLNNSLVSTGTVLADKIIDMGILCTAPVLVAYHIVDNRSETVYTETDISGAAGTEARYGLNYDASGNPIGFYAFNMATTSLNGSSGRLISTSDLSSSNWTVLGGSSTPAVASYISFTESAGSSPVPVTSANVNLTVKTTLAPMSKINTTQEINLDGSSTVELLYL
jgi:hypothetical protein